jgi:hypothetical protein
VTKKLANIFKATQLPAVLCVASEGQDSEDTITFSKLTDSTTGQNITILSNLDEPRSPITGEPIEKASTNLEEASASLDRKETLAAFVCVASCLGCNHDSYVTPEVAEQIDGKDFHCSNCGEAVTAFYDGDFADVSADELSEDSEDDITDALEEVDEPMEDEEEGKDEEDESEEDDSEKESDEEDDESEDDAEVEDEEDSMKSKDKESSKEMASSSDTNSNVDDASVDNSPAASEEDITPKVAVVNVASAADYEGNLQFATLADTSRYEVFLGNNHIGSLLKDEASAGIQTNFTKQDLVRNVFGKTFWKHSAEIASGDFSTLSEFGFKPSTIKVQLDKVIASEIEAAEEENASKIEDAIKEAEASVVATMTVAAAGINKGMLTGTNLYAEVAKLLNRYGVQKAEEAAARFVEEISEPYFSAVVTAAAELRKESPDYVRGLSKSIETASYKKPVEAGADLITSALMTQKPVTAPKQLEIARAEHSNSGKMTNVFSRYNRR